MKKKYLPIIVVLLFLAGCASTGTTTSTGASSDFISNSYKLLSANGTTADTAMKSIAMLYSQKQVGEDVKARAIDAMNKFKIAYDDAVDKLTAYSKTPSDASKLAAQTAIATVELQVGVIVALNVIPAK